MVVVVVGGGGGDPRSQMQAARGRRQKAASLPLDVLVDIAARTDPATFVRCAATCVDMRCRVKEYISLRAPLRLQHGDRFVLPLLRGHLIYGSHDWSKPKEKLFLLDTSAPDATKLRTSTRGGFPLSSRDGLVLGRVGVAKELRVCDPATGRSLTLPSEPMFRGWSEKSYVLLVGDCDKALVTGGAVHWLCQTDTGSYVLRLRVKAAKVIVTKLPKGFPHNEEHQKLLATSSVGGDVLVLVAHDDKISAWAQSQHTAKWKQRPHVVINMTETILRFLDKAGGSCIPPTKPVKFSLVWFAEKSGTVLINACRGSFWLDLQSWRS
ncbi:hypothetical protein VPH35_114395 [Triticum aestivum]